MSNEERKFCITVAIITIAIILVGVWGYVIVHFVTKYW